MTQTVRVSHSETTASYDDACSFYLGIDTVDVDVDVDTAVNVRFVDVDGNNRAKRARFTFCFVDERYVNVNRT